LYRLRQCHFWSNFEIADMDFFRSDAYLSFFKHLDQAGGFFYERWGDAPVHSIGAALLLDKSDFHYFDNVGYFHSPIMHCPKVAKESAISPYLGRSRCYCAHESSFTFDDNRQSCLYNYLEIMGKNSSAARNEFMKLEI
jgi:alpha 1,2-mannosyltransferase